MVKIHISFGAIFGIVHTETKLNGYGMFYDRLGYGIGDNGEVQLKFTIQNYGKKTAKYVKISFVPVNSVYDELKDELKIYTYTGFIKQYEEVSVTTDVLWKNPTIRTIKIDKIEVVYTDGTSEECKENYYPKKGEEKRYSIKQNPPKQEESEQKEECRQKGKFDDFKWLFKLILGILLYEFILRFLVYKILLKL